MKRLLSLVLSFIMIVSLFSIASVSVFAKDIDAEETSESTDEVIYFNVNSTGWTNVTSVFCHIWAIDGTGSWRSWQSKKEKCTYNSSSGIATYDLSKTGNDINEGAKYGVIFSSGSNQTYNLLMGAECIGKTAYCDGTEYENPEDSSKTALAAFWDGMDPEEFGPQLTITSIGNVVGTCLPAGTTKVDLVVAFIENYLVSARASSKKTDQELFDDIRDALELTNSDIQNAIYNSGEEGINWSPAGKDHVFSGHSLSLEGEIGINYFLNLTEEDITNGTTVDFAWESMGNKRSYSYTVSEYDYVEDLGLYKVTCYVSSAEMTCKITASYSVNGETKDETDLYSVYIYCNYILSEDYNADEALSNLVKSMLSYGSKSQAQFECNTDVLADNQLVTDDETSTYYYNPSDISADDITDTKDNMDADLSGYGLSYTGTAATYLTNMSLRHYYEITDQEKFDQFVKDTSFTYHKNSNKGENYIYIESSDINPNKYNKAFEFYVGDATCKYSVLDYVKACINDNTVSDNMKALAQATYRYYEYADIYFAN